MNLAELQTLFWRGARGEATPSELDAAFCARGARTGALRMEMYRSAYFTRLRAALAETFPATRRALGDATFTAFATKHALERPSRHPDIERAGEGFAELLASTPDAAAFGPLARLEWTRLCALLAPDRAPLVRLSLDGVNVEHVRFRWVPSLALCVADARSLRALTAEPGDDAEGPLHVAFWRKGTRVRHRALEPVEVCALVPMTTELSLVSLCERVARASDDPEHTVARLVGRYLRDGWICDPNQEPCP